MFARTKPSVLERNHERRLAKIATRGVVQLFNAIEKQQKEDFSEVAESGEKKRKSWGDYKEMDKDSFLDMLKGAAPKTKLKANKVKVKDEDDDEGGSKWDVLQDDYMMGGKLGDWDKESDSE